jgi:hypothetical protein
MAIIERKAQINSTINYSSDNKGLKLIKIILTINFFRY